MRDGVEALAFGGTESNRSGEEERGDSGAAALIVAVEKPSSAMQTNAIELKFSPLGWQRRVGVGRRGEEK